MTEDIPSKQPHSQHNNPHISAITQQYLLERLREIDRLSEHEYNQLRNEVAQLKKIYATSKAKIQTKHRLKPKAGKSARRKH